MPLILDGTTGASLIATTAIPASVVLSTPASGTMTNVTSVPAAQLTGTVAVANGGTGGASNFTGFKNRIINGAMVIDQRNAGAAWGTAIVGYTVDRWQCLQSVTGKLNGGQNYNSITPPTGFANYIGAQSQSAYVVGAIDYYTFSQYIEGFNAADLAWGTASASAITLSFWVRSSLTGTFGGTVRNNAANYNYPFDYTISVANTWERKTITIAGPTSGAWLTTNGLGMAVWFGLGVGSTYSGTAGAWTTTASIVSATGATSVVGTNGATFYLTGVQLEVGSTATSFEYRPYGTELALCQRYFQASIYSGSSLTLGGGGVAGGNGTGLDILTPLVVTMRIAPTVSVPTVTNGYFAYNNSGGTALTNSGSGVSSSPTMVSIRFGGFASVAPWSFVESRQTGAGYTATAEL